MSSLYSAKTLTSDAQNDNGSVFFNKPKMQQLNDKAP